MRSASGPHASGTPKHRATATFAAKEHAGLLSSKATRRQLRLGRQVRPGPVRQNSNYPARREDWASLGATPPATHRRRRPIADRPACRYRAWQASRCQSLFELAVDENEGDPAVAVRAVGPTMIGAALDDDVARTNGRLAL